MGNFMAPVNHRADANMYLQIYREERTYVVTILNLSEIFKNVVLYYTDLIFSVGTGYKTVWDNLSGYELLTNPFLGRN